MRVKHFLIILFCLICRVSLLSAQNQESQKWVDSVLASLSADEKIAQLMVVRAHSNLGSDHVNSVTKLIKKFNIGGLCFFQGGPIRQANLTNYYQSLAKTPLLICIDAEWGLGMRLDSVLNYPRQLMVGAVNDPEVVYAYGKAVGEQCVRMGIHVNYAPVVDVNNNPSNPVINDRSFGEDIYKVAHFGVQYMKGMQDIGVMACAKHFPGHGDVSVDSHYDLPVINKSRAQLDSLELYPFRKLFEAGVKSVMIAHLYIPSIDSTPDLATSLSHKNVTDLLRNELGYEGISFTDALEMKGVAKYFPAGEAAVQSLIAGNDILCLPGDIEESIKLVKKAIKKDKLSWTQIDASVKKLLFAKYNAGLHHPQTISLENLTEDLNKDGLRIQQLVADHAITVLKDDKKQIPITPNQNKKIAYVGIGISADNAFSLQMKDLYQADTYFFDYKQDLSRVATLTELLRKKYDQVVVGVHQYSRRPANGFGISSAAIQFVNKLNKETNAVTVVFGNPYAIGFFPEATSLLVCYEDDVLMQRTAIDILLGTKEAKGSLPVTVSPQLHFGTGIHNYLERQATIDESKTTGLSETKDASTIVNLTKLSQIREVVLEAIRLGATPGGVVLVAKDGEVVFEEAFGHYDYTQPQAVGVETVYDVASITKIAATTVAMMKLFDEGKIKLNRTLGEYLPIVRGSNKEKIRIDDLLLHQSGLKAFIPFYKETVDNKTGKPLNGFYQSFSDTIFNVPIAESMYLRKDFVEKVWRQIVDSEALPAGKYVYSDLNFLLLGKMVEHLTGKPLDEYVRETFYAPLEMIRTTFNPEKWLPLSSIAPSTNESGFRQQQIRGFVHDESAAILGGVAGNAGLFSNAHDLWKLFQMLLNGGEFEGKRYLKKETINLFTSYGTAVSRRGLGFDKPEKDNNQRNKPYPTASASPFTFGHTGFTGTSVWVDPAENLIVIILSNRTFPDANNSKLSTLEIRLKVHDIVYSSLMK